MLGGLLLVPPTVATGSTLGIMPVAVSGFGGVPLPTAGDVLRALAGGQSGEEDLGASGRLPEADTLSSDVIDALAEPTGPNGPTTGAGPLATIPLGPLGIPGIALDAYDRAANRVATTNPRCGVTWSVLAAIGRVESGHARGGRVDANGTTVSPILGPRLNGGPGIAAIRDSDGGRLDGDTTWDRAVGPMQFIPTTWARYAIDGNDDGLADPHNIFDAALAAAHYLCASGEDLRDRAALARAIFRYNHSDTYVRNVMDLADAYAAGVTRLDAAPVGPAQPIPPPAPPAPPPPTTSPTPPTTTPPTSTTTPSATTPPSTTRWTPTTTTQPTTTPTTTRQETTTTSPAAGPSTTCTPPTSPTETTTPTTPTTPPCTEAGPAEAPAAVPSETTSSMPSA